ncbi:DoxX family protein [Streptomyces stramineus]|uniref:DoxX family protein n=1 Tax=Streptomyces stramineus TaxID=173861 RepID=A0ABN0ZWS6_9ACTN
MSTAHLAATAVAAAMASFSAAVSLLGTPWAERSLTDYGVPRSWWTWLGVAKAAGAAGLLAGLVVPFIGVMAGIGLVLYYAGALVTVVRAHRFAHIPAPLVFAVPVVCALLLGRGRAC